MKSTKQETIEQASEYHAHNYFDMHETNNYKALKQGFEAGAKWQQEQDNKMYSEEDMLDYASYILHNDVITPKKWFEQFKNK